MDMFAASEDYPQGQRHQVLAELDSIIPYYRAMAPGVPLLFAICAPCQSFTKFVQRRMTTDRASGRDRDQNLLSQTIDFVAKFRPELIVSENVANIRTGQYRDLWADFERRMGDLGYQTGTAGVCASRFGVPQYRRRSILMGIRREHCPDLNFKLRIPDHDPEASSSPSAKEAIDHLPPLMAGENCKQISNHRCRDLTSINRLRLMSVVPGQSNFGFDETNFGDLSLPCHRRLAEKGKRGFGDVYTRIHPDRPAPTITTRFHSVSNGRFGHYDQEQVRGLSLREGALLQSFGEGYEFYGDGMDSIAKMVGNAVPPKLSAYMASWLYGLWVDNATDSLTTAG